MFQPSLKVGQSLTEIDEILTNKNYNQPILVSFDNGQLYLKLDHQFCLLNTSSTTYGIDLLFKCFWVFNIEYPQSASYFYIFLEMIFGLAQNLKPILTEFMDLINSA